MPVITLCAVCDTHTLTHIYIYDFRHFSLTLLVNCNQLLDLKG